MTTAIIGTGGIGSAIARQLASGGETLRLSSADNDSARALAAQIGRAAVVAAGNRDALQGAGAVVLALRFTVLKGVIDEIAGPLTDKLVVVPSNPLSTDAHGNVSRVLPEGQSSGKVVAGWLPAGARLAMAFGTLSADVFESAACPGTQMPAAQACAILADCGSRTGSSRASSRENSSRARACRPNATWPATSGWPTTPYGVPRCCSASAG